MDNYKDDTTQQTNDTTSKTQQTNNKQSNLDTDSKTQKNTINYLSDISKNKSVNGSITYQDQKDSYQYTAPVTGTYRFDTNLSAGGKVKLVINGENGDYIDSNINNLTINLEANKTYILVVEYYSNICDYDVDISFIEN